VAFAVSYLGKAPPDEVQQLVQDIRVPWTIDRKVTQALAPSDN
jgi:hypothetical protein